MFDFSEWVVAGIVDGYKKGYTSFAKLTELTANYHIKGIISKEQAEGIAMQCPPPLEENA